MILAKYSEILLKGKATRSILERILGWNIRVALEGCKFKISREGGIFFIEADEEERCAEKLRNVFGIVYISICEVVPADIDKIVEKCVGIGRKFRKGSSFAIRARRWGEHNFTSNDIGVKAGARMLSELRNRKLKVDLEEPSEEIFVDVRMKKAFISRNRIKACGGMPLGSQGKVVAVISDMSSYNAAWMMARRGCELVAVYNSKRGLKLAEKLEKWHIGRNMEAYNLSSKNNKISKEKLFEEAGRVARENDALGVVSGESLCKHQKLNEMIRLDAVAGVPVYRPLALLGEREVKMVMN